MFKEAEIKQISWDSENWHVICLPDDGARLACLRYKGFDILTTVPGVFVPPDKDYGKYETRPVYGYDDCFPAVEQCVNPDDGLEIPDHGTLCWLPWNVELTGNGMVCSVTTEMPSIFFVRELKFTETGLRWSFKILNLGGAPVSFQHVMHPLMPVDAVKSFTLPDYSCFYDAVSGATLKIGNGTESWNFFDTVRFGSARMIFLQGCLEGKFSVEFKNGLRVNVSYPFKIFPTLGVWWNNGGYPDEDGLRRKEFAIEPVPGKTSTLPDAVRDGLCQQVEPSSTLNWDVDWEMEKGGGVKQ